MAPRLIPTPGHHPVEELTPLRGQDTHAYTVTTTSIDFDPTCDETPCEDLDHQPLTPSLTRWQILLHATPNAGHPIEVASATITVANPAAGNPARDLDLLGWDEAELGAVVFDGRNWSEPITESVPLPDAPGPVALVETFTVHPAFRGPLATPLIALRVLAPFAALGIEVAALSAAPVCNLDDPTRFDEDTLAAAAEKIAAMWERAGFTRVAPSDRHPEDDNPALARRLDPMALRREIRALADAPWLRRLAGLA